MSDAFTSSFVNRTNPSPYHQALVLSQAMINNAFENMWFVAEEDSNLHNVNMSIRGAGNLRAKILAPKIAIQVTTLNPQLYYLLQFESGKLWLYLSNDESDDSKKEWDVAGWVFAFPVSICTSYLFCDIYFSKPTNFLTEDYSEKNHKQKPPAIRRLP